MNVPRQLRFRINFSILICFLVIASICSVLLTFYEKHRRDNAIQRIHHALVDIVARREKQLGSEIFAGHRRAVGATLNEILKRQAICAVSVYDSKGELFRSSLANAPPNLSGQKKKALTERTFTDVKHIKGDQAATYATELRVSGERVGYCRISHSLSALNRETWVIITIFCGLLFGSFALSSLLLNWMLSRLVLHPVWKLEKTMRFIIPGKENERGRKTDERIHTLQKMTEAFDRNFGDIDRTRRGQCEIESLARSFRQMVSELETTYAELTSAEENYRGIIENAAEGIFQAAPDGRLLTANPAMAQMFGFNSTADLLESNLNIGKQLSGENGELATSQSFFERLAGDETMADFDAQLEKTGGERFWGHLHVTARTVRDNGEDVFLIEGTVQDITARKTAQERLRENERNLEITLDSIGDAVIATDIHGKIKRMNPVAQKLSGWQTDKAENKFYTEVLDIVSMNTGISSDDPVQRVLKTGQEAETAHHIKLVSAEGNEHHVAASAAPIRDRDGGMTGSVLVARDVTEEHGLRASLEERERRYHTVFESVMNGIAILDLGGQIRDANAAFCEMHGYSKEELHGRPVSELVHEDYHHMLASHLDAIKNDENISGEAVNVCSDGSLRNVYVRGCAITLDRQRFLLAVLNDITEQKRAEAELQKIERLQSVGTLAGGIAHDFNNIFMGLYGNISIAKSELNEDHPAYVAIIDAESSMNRAKRLSNQLLTFAKGGQPVTEGTRLENIVEEIVSFDLSGSNVKPVFNAVQDLWAAEVDSGQIQQVFSNLTLNADEAMPEGGYLHLTFENAEITGDDIAPPAPGKYVKTIMRDEGNGIEPAHIERIFEPYYTEKEDGNGLGLAMVYSIVEKHGGHISVDSTPAVGTTFIVYLPASEKASPQTSVNTTQTGIVHAENPPEILVMDDEEVVCDVAAVMLRKIGCKVETTACGEEALEVYRRRFTNGTPFDLVLLDLTVRGGMGGVKTLQQILALDPDVKAIISSGYTEDETMARYTDYGFRGIVTKPYTRKQLEEVLTSVLTGDQSGFEGDL